MNKERLKKELVNCGFERRMGFGDVPSFVYDKDFVIIISDKTFTILDEGYVSVYEKPLENFIYEVQGDSYLRNTLINLNFLGWGDQQEIERQEQEEWAEFLKEREERMRKQCQEMIDEMED